LVWFSTEEAAEERQARGWTALDESSATTLQTTRPVWETSRDPAVQAARVYWAPRVGEWLAYCWSQQRAAQAAKKEALAKNAGDYRRKPLDELIPRMREIGLDVGFGVELHEPGDRMLPAPRSSPTLFDQQVAARERLRKERNEAPRPMQGDRSYDQMQADALAADTWGQPPTVPQPTAPIAPQPPPPVQPTAPQPTHARNMTKEAFRALLGKFGI